MTEALTKCTTRHVRIFTAIYEDSKLIEDLNHLTLDLDPDNEFIWDDIAIEKVQTLFNIRILDEIPQNQLLNL